MEILEHLLVLAHLLGMAAIVGSAVFVARGAVTPALVWGARAQLLTGILLVGLAEAGDDDHLNNTKIAVKLVFPLMFGIFPSMLVVLAGPAVIRIYRHLMPMLHG